MAILPIETEHKTTNRILRNRSDEVRDIADPSVQKLIADMHETLTHTEHGVALAAPQVGANLRIFVVLPDAGVRQTVFINPVITKRSDERVIMDEGCLSTPGVYGKIERVPMLKVEAQNERGRKFKLKVEGLVAQIVQHEVGHLDGELFIDKAISVRDQQKQ